jgi:hypothetical protein
MARAWNRWAAAALAGRIVLSGTASAQTSDGFTVVPPPLPLPVPAVIVHAAKSTEVQREDPKIMPVAAQSVMPPVTPPIPAAPAFPRVRPPVLNRPIDAVLPPPPDEQPGAEYPSQPFDPPLGYTGPSGVLPRIKADKDFVPVEDRWRIGFPAWDRADYDADNPKTGDYPYQLGRLFDPFNQNVFKGDYPIIGQHTFLNITATQTSLFEGRTLPTPTTPFESTARPFTEEFFGRYAKFFSQNFTSLSFDLFHGDTAAFKPVDWRIKVTPIFNFNYNGESELGIVSPDVSKGQNRARTWWTLEEYFVEAKICDLSPDYDFASARIGSQFFTSDFRGFIFSQTNRAARIFGTLNANRDQFNLLYFRPTEKDTNSGLNSFNDRPQNILIGNYYHQDFIWPGYTIQGSVHWDNDLGGGALFDRNKFLVRPDPAGVFQNHQVDAVYFGFTGDGHIDRYNITHAFYWAIGHDTLNPIANQEQQIDAKMAAVEISYDRDWARFRTSYFYASGDGNASNSHATGFDSIFDNPNFAGGQFSFWQRQAIGLFGNNLVQRESLVPDLRSSKIQGQANFVNPGLQLINAGVDFDITPKLRSINNVNMLFFDKTNSLETFTFDGKIDRTIGVDLSTGLEYRPLLTNNIIFTGGFATLLPGQGFKQLYNRLGRDVNPLIAGFLEMVLLF